MCDYLDANYYETHHFVKQNNVGRLYITRFYNSFNIFEVLNKAEKFISNEDNVLEIHFISYDTGINTSEIREYKILKYFLINLIKKYKERIKVIVFEATELFTLLILNLSKYIDIYGTNDTMMNFVTSKVSAFGNSEILKPELDYRIEYLENEYKLIYEFLSKEEKNKFCKGTAIILNSNELVKRKIIKLIVD